MAEEVALISIGRVQTSDVKQYAELVIDFSDQRYFSANVSNSYFNSDLSWFFGYNIENGKALPLDMKYQPERNLFNHNAFMLATEVNGQKVGGNYFDENKYYADADNVREKKIAAFVSTTAPLSNKPNNYGVVVNLSTEQFKEGDVIRVRFADKGVLIDGEEYYDREVFLKANTSYTMVNIQPYMPFKLISVNLVRRYSITNEQAQDFIIEDQIATTDSALEFGVYLATAKVSCVINPTMAEFIANKDVSVVLRNGKEDKNILQEYAFTLSEMEELPYNRYTLTLDNRVKQMQEEYLSSIGPAEERTIKELLDYTLGIGAYDIVDDDKGSIESHINNTVVKQVFSEAKSKYDFLLELCQIGMFNISFDTRFKIWRVF
jgi:hypothetical protein